MNLISRLNDHVCFNCNHNLIIETICNKGMITYCNHFKECKGFILPNLKNEIVVSCEYIKEEKENGKN